MVVSKGTDDVLTVALSDEEAEHLLYSVECVAVFADLEDAPPEDQNTPRLSDIGKTMRKLGVCLRHFID